MNVPKIWILLLLILAASLPVIAVFFWLRAKKSAVTRSWFLVSFVAGIVSFLTAILLQNFFPYHGRDDRFIQLLFGVFIRIALVEEVSRLVTIVPLLKAGKYRDIDGSNAATLGLAAGLGFAALENAFYGLADIHITLIRAFTAAPLHGACGIRAGTAVFLIRRRPAKALFAFIYAVLIHGAYNLMILIPAIPSVLAVLTALAAFFGSLSLVKTAEKNPSPLS
jgi:RsiW-degrading membrane proteinase PrsW (M82 family)